MIHPKPGFWQASVGRGGQGDKAVEDSGKSMAKMMEPGGLAWPGKM